MKNLRIVVVGTMGSDPYAGMAWMIMQIVAGLHRLGHEVWYFETTSTWPFDPRHQTRVQDPGHAIGHIAGLMERFGMPGRWAYRCSYGDKRWIGMDGQAAVALLAGADIVFNVAGATCLAEEGLGARRFVYLGTDPVFHEVNYAKGDPEARAIVDEHTDSVTYGENIGNAGCPIPPLPHCRARTRQPILMDMWQLPSAPSGAPFTTVGNWKQGGRDVELGGEVYRWSKHHEFLKIIDLPTRTKQPLELATNLAPSSSIRHGAGNAVPALGFEQDEYALLVSNGWTLVDAPSFTTDPFRYRDYIASSRGELTVARDLNVRLRSGWFSERSACYLAAGRPVITQDTGFGCALPLGEGLFAFSTKDEALAALDAINADYERHSRAARAIAAEYFRAERVLRKLLEDLGA